MALHRVLDADPVLDLQQWRDAGGLRAFDDARRTPDALVPLITDAGLRGRGGAGFPTGTKWATVADNAGSSPIAPTVVVNAAEGEPGTFGDRTLIRRNPYKVLEGALIAAVAIGAKSIVVTTKERYAEEVRRLTAARDDLVAAGVPGEIDIEIIAAASHYLLGEETGLLEATAGRPPFPRIAPPYRHGATEVGDSSGGAAAVHLAGQQGDAPPTLVNNVETLAHVVDIVRHGPDWFREMGTPESPGTSVFTVSGDVDRAAVGEFALGTPVEDVIAALAGHVPDDATFLLSGVANEILVADRFDTATTYEGMRDAGSGLGTGGFIVFTTATDPLSVAQGVSRFLAVESCGQCTPCKQDGLEVSQRLDDIRRGDAGSDTLERLPSLVARVPEGARCDLGRQHERVVGSLLTTFSDVAAAHVTQALETEAVLIAPIREIDEDGNALLDEDQRSKQPDWQHGETWNGQSPADRYDVSVTID